MHGDGDNVNSFGPDGRRYVGGYMNNKKHGKGTYHYKDGSKYEGNWSSGKMHGEGIKTNKDGESYTGQY